MTYFLKTLLIITRNPNIVRKYGRWKGEKSRGEGFSGWKIVSGVYLRNESNGSEVIWEGCLVPYK
jgi:hypothetical protein